MIKPSVNLQELRRRIYRKAKAEKQWRFWGLYAHVAKTEILTAAYREAKAHGGSAGIDGESFESIEIHSLEKFLAEIRRELLAGSYKPSANRQVEIPKGNGKTRRSAFPP
jgi:RNA-directed DNA polymerase